MKVKYTIPKTSSVSIVCANIIASSEERGLCNERCKHWHFCRDRQVGKDCSDKEYQYYELEEMDKIRIESIAAFWDSIVHVLG